MAINHCCSGLKTRIKHELGIKIPSAGGGVADYYKVTSLGTNSCDRGAGCCQQIKQSGTTRALGMHGFREKIPYFPSQKT